MTKYIKILAITILSGFTSNAYSQQIRQDSTLQISQKSTCTCENMSGEWLNPSGSALVIENVDKTGSIKGYYLSSVGTDGQRFPLIGWVNQKPYEAEKDNTVAITFSVSWGEYGSITSWTGYCKNIDSVPTIQTSWHLVRPVTDESYEHILTGGYPFIPK